jgi:endonuclease III
MNNRERAVSVVDNLRNYYGKVSPALEYRNTYELTIAVVLSAQTTDKQVNAVTPALFKQYPGFPDLADAKLKDVELIIRSTGFYHHKAKNIIALAAKVINSFGGVLPETREGIMSLPGAGRKTANVILSQGFGVPAFAVDTHVGRISRRLGFSMEDDPLKVESDVCALIPEKDWTEAHLLFITHGRKICTARSPVCGECPVRDMCLFPDKAL